MSEAKSVKMSYDVVGGDFDRAGEASGSIKRMLQKSAFLLILCAALLSVLTKPR